jgi:Domain of unknown function DUF29
MSELYDTDILLWSEEQSKLLRRLAAGERVNAEIDWEKVIDEVESVGTEQLHAVSSLLVQALAHMLKAQAWPNSREAPHWQAEARRFRMEAADRFAPSMRRRLDLDRLYRRALRILPDTFDGATPQPLPAACPITLDELLAEP